MDICFGKSDLLISLSSSFVPFRSHRLITYSWATVLCCWYPNPIQRVHCDFIVFFEDKTYPKASAKHTKRKGSTKRRTRRRRWRQKYKVFTKHSLATLNAIVLNAVKTTSIIFTLIFATIIIISTIKNHRRKFGSELEKFGILRHNKKHMWIRLFPCTFLRFDSNKKKQVQTQLLWYRYSMECLHFLLFFALTLMALMVFLLVSILFAFTWTNEI